jgi:DNA-binding NtrC family response regulator
MDLYYRLNVFQIALPALRERMEDLPVLVEALLGPLNEKYGCRVADVEPEVLGAFRRHAWPGNVRELRNLLARAVIVAGEGTIGVRHLPPGFAGLTKAAAPVGRTDEEGVYLPIGSTVQDAERALIERTLEHTGNNKTRAAAILGIGLKTLHNKLKQYREADT